MKYEQRGTETEKGDKENERAERRETERGVGGVQSGRGGKTDRHIVTGSVKRGETNMLAQRGGGGEGKEWRGENMPADVRSQQFQVSRVFASVTPLHQSTSLHVRQSPL